MGDTGLEPVTSSVSCWRASQLRQSPDEGKYSLVLGCWQFALRWSRAVQGGGSSAVEIAARADSMSVAAEGSPRRRVEEGLWDFREAGLGSGRGGRRTRGRFAPVVWA